MSTGCTEIDPRGKGTASSPAIWDDSLIPTWKKFADAMHAHGAKLVPQLHHAGRQTKPDLIGGLPPVAPSSIPCPVCKEMPHELTLEEIEEAITEIGLHIDDGLLFRIRRALHYYSEETQRANLGCSRGESNCTTKVFAVRYRALDHGCRDHRPEHWRRYL